MFYLLPYSIALRTLFLFIPLLKLGLLVHVLMYMVVSWSYFSNTEQLISLTSVFFLLLFTSPSIHWPYYLLVLLLTGPSIDWSFYSLALLFTGPSID